MNREGWVPIRVKWQDEDAFVDWCWLGGERFTEPFFDSTIEIALRKPFNALFTHRTSMAELGEWHAASPGLIPAGFIFHMSRCGSTLVSQMLAAVPGNVVISEARPIDWLARACWIPEPTRAEWLRWMVSALGQKRSECETHYFIKFDSPTVLALTFIREAFPDVPWIFLYRDPEEVLTSHIQEPAAAMSRGFVNDVSVIDAPMPEVLSMSAEEYAARVIGRLCESVAAGVDDRGLLVNYAQLPEAAWGEIARHFNVEVSTDDLRLMQQVASRDAKRPHLRFETDRFETDRFETDRFQTDGEHKRREVSAAVRQAAARWILPYYAELERLRLRGCRKL